MKHRSLEEIAGQQSHRRVPFSSLMRKRVHSILLVSSLYDSFTFQEDGNLGEMLFSEYQELNLSSAPAITRVSTAAAALDVVRQSPPDLIITMPRVGEMDVFEFGGAVKKMVPDLPIVLLAYDTRELALLEARDDHFGVDRIFVWLGDARLFLTIIKWVEDRLNAVADAETAGVKILILVEDSVHFYSVFLPMLYTEMMEQTQALMAEGVNRMQKLLRMRARPKILLASSYEEAKALYEQYGKGVLGMMVDARFPRNGKKDGGAGADLISWVRDDAPDMPILMTSRELDNEGVARRLGAAFINKNSPTLLHGVRDFLRGYLGFGDFIFRTPGGETVARARDLRGVVSALASVPDESVVFHACRNDFSMWLMARTEFELASALRPRRPDEFESTDALRAYLLKALRDYRNRARAGLVEEFFSDTFEADGVFTRIGTGSLGGKGRGLAFMNSLIGGYSIEHRFPGVRIHVPPTVVIATDVFDRFMHENDLARLALSAADDTIIKDAFLRVSLPDDIVNELRTFIERVEYPLAVRSSSLLEDSSYQPFAGIYQTYMLPNNDPDSEQRLKELCCAVRLVYASTYCADSKGYIDSTPNRLEDEKMAVVIQQVTGRMHGDYLYPDAAGVARSYDYYPVKDLEPEDGVASAVLGMGRMVTDGGRCVRFSPAAPAKLFQFSSTEAYLANSQREFYALDLNGPAPVTTPDASADSNLVLLDMETAMEHDTLAPVGSVYSAENDRVYEGVHRPGVKMVTMAGFLSGDCFPLPEVLGFLLEVGRAGLSTHIEIEFAVILRESGEKPHEFSFLQIRPLVFDVATEDLELSEIDTDDAICLSERTLGHGSIAGIRDIVIVKPDAFDRAKTPDIATEIGAINAALKKEARPYLLIGPGRWGSADHWLGIPVNWAQISGARCIIEDEIEGITIEPSQGTHFFQNITSFGIGYFTMRSAGAFAKLDHDWLASQKPASEGKHVSHIRLDSELEILINSRTGLGAIMKPGRSVVEPEE